MLARTIHFLLAPFLIFPAHFFCFCNTWLFVTFRTSFGVADPNIILLYSGMGSKSIRCSTNKTRNMKQTTSVTSTATTPTPSKLTETQLTRRVAFNYLLIQERICRRPSPLHVHPLMQQNQGGAARLEQSFLDKLLVNETDGRGSSGGQIDSNQHTRARLVFVRAVICLSPEFNSIDLQRAIEPLEVTNWPGRSIQGIKKPIASAFVRNCSIVQMKMKTSYQELRVYKISPQFVAPSGCSFYDPKNEKNILYLKPCSLSITRNGRFNLLISMNPATPSGFSWNQLELRNPNSIFWTDLVDQ